MKGKLTKVLLWAFLAIVLAGMLIPVRDRGIDDGGSTVYGALLYEVWNYHVLRWNVKGYVEGTGVEVLGHTVYDDTLRKTSVFGDTDAITAVSFSTVDGTEAYEVPADDLDEMIAWLCSFRFLNAAEGEKTLPGMEFFTATIHYDGGMTYTGPLGVMKRYADQYYVWGDPIPDAFYRTLGIDSEE